MGKLLRLASIEKSYNITRKQKQQVLKGLSAEFDRGEFVALVGESGCGKSTLMNIIGGLDTEYTGSVIVKDKFIRDFNENEMDDYRKKRVGMVFQNYNLITHMNLAENIEIAMRMSDIASDIRHNRALELLEMVGLKDYADKYPTQLSGGQQQRVAIARALANNPSIILADEPTGALDKDSEDVILEILKKIVQTGKLVIIVTHSDSVASHCNRVVRIGDGVIESDEEKYKLKKKGTFEKTIMPKPIKTKDVAKLSFRNTRQKLSRSLLVSIGLSLGIAAMVLISNLGTGLENYVNDVYGDATKTTQLVLTLDEDRLFDEDVEEMITSIEGVDTYYSTSTTSDIEYTYEEIDSTINHTSTYYSDYYPEILYGSISLTEGSVIINENLASNLTDDGLISVVGEDITLDYEGVEYIFTITGIYDDVSDASDYNGVLMNESDLELILDDDYDLNTMYVNLESVEYVTSALSDLETLNINVFQEDDSANSVLSYIDMGTKVLTGVSGVSMIVAAIMIFIVLYISIVERTKEIGILRAIGARKKDISKMFLFEASMLGLMGGIFGIIFVVLITLFTNTVTGISLETQLISYNIWYYLVGILLSVIVSVLAGIAPAIKAADLDPAVALRYE